MARLWASLDTGVDVVSYSRLRRHSSVSWFRVLPNLPGWVYVSLIFNGLLLATVFLLWEIAFSSASGSSTELPTAYPGLTPLIAEVRANPELGPRHQLTYQEWVELLAQEARVASEKRPSRLSILAGDSISLWFPADLLPPDRTWLNQGISGETSAGLLKRLNLLDETRPETVFVMIGINDLLRGWPDADLLINAQEILRYLKVAHPQAQIVLQSILPHADRAATWEGKDRLNNIPNPRIRSLNSKLQQIAREEGVYFLDLYPLFADRQGNLQLSLSTDGLHLSLQGYQVWRTALQMFDQLRLARTQT